MKSNGNRAAKKTNRVKRQNIELKKISTSYFYDRRLRSKIYKKLKNIKHKKDK